MIEKYEKAIHIALYSIFLTIIVVLYIYISSQKEIIEDKNKAIISCTLEKVNSDNNNVTLKATITELNEKNSRDTINAEYRDKEYIKQITVLNKQVRKVGSNECEDIKIRINTIRGTDYTRLLNK